MLKIIKNRQNFIKVLHSIKGADIHLSNRYNIYSNQQYITGVE